MIRFFVRLAIALTVEKWLVKPQPSFIVRMDADSSKAFQQIAWLQEQITLLDNTATPYPVVLDPELTGGTS